MVEVRDDGIGGAEVARPDPAAAAPVVAGAHHAAAPAAPQQALQQPAALADCAAGLPGRGRQFVLPDEWTAETGELTPTLKRRRRVIADRYASEIDQLYQ